jgi:hypothetical protein
MLRRMLAWRDQANLYAPDVNALHYQFAREEGLAVADWRSFWGVRPQDFVEGRVRYQGGDLLARLADEPEKITPDDFRLRPDSDGYRAGPDGKDLGADVDLVGPGPAYERWKQTAEYQEWLKETGQAVP